ncbi:MAG: hypothetical protein U5K69_23600 [Balneolaceae bacterium]|nr:hypothetical protein [Balneolaceae bacterium]
MKLVVQDSGKVRVINVNIDNPTAIDLKLLCALSKQLNGDKGVNELFTGTECELIFSLD